MDKEICEQTGSPSNVEYCGVAWRGADKAGAGEAGTTVQFKAIPLLPIAFNGLQRGGGDKVIPADAWWIYAPGDKG